MFYKWIRVKTAIVELLDLPEKMGINGLCNCVWRELSKGSFDSVNYELCESLDKLANCMGETEFQKAADRLHSALFRWIEREYGRNAANIENQVDSILSGKSLHIN